MWNFPGDPGLGKSQLLRSASACVPRGIYVCGNASSAAGLTVAVVKDSLSGDYVFEAGPKVNPFPAALSLDFEISLILPFKMTSN